MCFSCECLRYTAVNIRSAKCNGSKSHDGSSLPFDFKLPFKNAFKSILIKSNLINYLINQLKQQMKNKMQVKAEINLASDINLKC